MSVRNGFFNLYCGPCPIYCRSARSICADVEEAAVYDIEICLYFRLFYLADSYIKVYYYITRVDISTINDMFRWQSPQKYQQREVYCCEVSRDYGIPKEHMCRLRFRAPASAHAATATYVRVVVRCLTLSASSIALIY